MRRFLLFCLLVVVVVAYQESSPFKTKKYKCIEIAEDEEVQIVKKKKESASKYPWKAEEEKMRRIGTARVAAVEEMEEIQMPQARAVNREKSVVAPVTPPSTSDVPRDAKGRPLILSPDHCKQVKHYAQVYGVKDVTTWVRSNCAFAKMYVPGATCEEIDILVASCYSPRSDQIETTP